MSALTDAEELLGGVEDAVAGTPCEVVTAWNIAGLELDVRCGDRALFEALHAYLGSHAGAPSGARPDVEMTFVVDDELAGRLEAAAPGLPGTRPAMISYCSTEKGSLPVEHWRAGGATLLRTLKTRTWLLADAAYSRLAFVVGGDYPARPTVHKDLALLVLHVLQRTLEARGQLQIHASAVVVDGQAVLFSGPKRSGKTTCFLDAIVRTGARPLSVDKVHLAADPVTGGFQVFGIPTRLRVLAGTLQKYPGSWDGFIPEEYRGVGEERLWRGESDSKVSIPLTSLRTVTGKDFTLQAPLGMIVLPDVARGREPLLREVTDPLEVAELMRPNVYTPDNPEEDWWSGIGEHLAADLRARAEDFLAGIGATVPILRLEGAERIDHLIQEAQRRLRSRTAAAAEAEAETVPTGVPGS
ncbi:hypothetical protein [Streptosporangium sp. NPDC051022]|uniref:hypothetical protein n=1 Tax=Streptosporangium sp. NPDC051022 TaxID=3155752 RepID=UPI00343C95CB